MVGNSTPEVTPPASSSHSLGLWDAVAIIVGIIIGSAIFQLPNAIFSVAGGPELALLVWGLVGALAFVGALCYAELTTTYPTAGGDYTYLTRAYGRRAGFFFAWSELAVIRTGGGIAFMAYVFANYFGELVDPRWDLSRSLGGYTTFVVASGGIIALSLINLAGLRPGKVTQNLLASAKVLGLLGLVVIALISYFETSTSAPAPNPEASTNTFDFSGFALAMVLVFYAYGGWNDAAFVAAEVRDGRRNLVRALLLGTLAVTVIYLLVNMAYLAALGYENAKSSDAIAADVFATQFGDEGRQVMAVIVIISALGAINGMIFTGMRLYGTFGRDHRLFGWLADRKGRPHGSAGAVIAQAAFSMLLIGVIESSSHWRGALAELAPSLGISVGEEFDEAGNIEKLVWCTSPVFWFFFLGSGLSLFVLRIRDPERERPFRVPLYPLTPMLFCATSAYMLYRSLDYALENEPAEAIIVIALVLLAFPLMWLSERSGIHPSHNKENAL